jgi:hypothetical protein
MSIHFIRDFIACLNCFQKVFIFPLYIKVMKEFFAQFLAFLIILF